MTQQKHTSTLSLDFSQKAFELFNQIEILPCPDDEGKFQEYKQELKVQSELSLINFLETYKKRLEEAYPEVIEKVSSAKKIQYTRVLYSSLYKSSRGVISEKIYKKSVLTDIANYMMPKFVRAMQLSTKVDIKSEIDYIFYEYIACICLIEGISSNNLNVTLEETKDKTSGERALRAYIVRNKAKIEAYTPAERRDRMIMDYVSNKGLDELEESKLYSYISKTMDGHNGVFRVRRRDEVVFENDKTLPFNFCIVPLGVISGFSRHIINILGLCIEHHDGSFSFSVVHYFSDKQKTPPEIVEDTLYIPDWIYKRMRAIHKRDGLTYIPENKIKLYKTLFHNEVGFRSFIIDNNAFEKEAGFKFPAHIRTHIIKRIRSGVRYWRMHSIMSDMMNRDILKVIRGTIRSANLSDYNWLVGAGGDSSVPKEIRMRNRLQILRLYPALLFEMIDMTDKIDRGERLTWSLPKSLVRGLANLTFHKINGYCRKNKTSSHIPYQIEENDNSFVLVESNFLKLPQPIQKMINVFLTTTDDIHEKFHIYNKSKLFAHMFLKRDIPISVIENADISIGGVNLDHLFDVFDITNKIEALLTGHIGEWIKAEYEKRFGRTFTIRPEQIILMLLIGDRLSLKSLAKQSYNFHARTNIQTLQRNVENRFSPYGTANDHWPALYKDVQYPEGSARFLTSREELIKEGSEMSHCVWSYPERCIYENSHIVSIVDSLGNRSTVQFVLDFHNGKKHISLLQNRGFDNQTPSVQCEHIAQRLLNEINADKKNNIYEKMYEDCIERKKEKKRNNNMDYLNTVYADELVAIGYSTVQEYMIEEIFKIYKPFLAKQYRNGSFFEALGSLMQATQR